MSRSVRVAAVHDLCLSTAMSTKNFYWTLCRLSLPFCARHAITTCLAHYAQTCTPLCCTASITCTHTQGLFAMADATDEVLFQGVWFPTLALGPYTMLPLASLGWGMWVVHYDRCTPQPQILIYQCNLTVERETLDYVAYCECHCGHSCLVQLLQLLHLHHHMPSVSTCSPAVPQRQQSYCA